jgi:hypothetical protein
LAAQAAASPAWAADWRPGPDLVAHIEARIVMPEGAHVLGAYRRTYAGVIVNRRRFVDGRFEWSKRPTVRIVTPERLPSISANGCGAVDLRYDVDADRLVSIACHPWT